MDQFKQEQFRIGKMVAEVSAPGNTFLLAFEKQRPVGFAMIRKGIYPLEWGEGTAIEIARIDAVRSFVGKVLGSALMQKSIEIAVERNKRSSGWECGITIGGHRIIYGMGIREIC